MVALLCSRAVSSGVGILLLTFPIAIRASSQDAPDRANAVWSRVHVPDPVANVATRQALGRASEWLAKPGCRSLLTDFTDQDGRPLVDRLSALDVDIPTYLTMIVIIDDTRHVRCADGAVAFTQPGSRVVRVCVDELKQVWHHDPTYTVAVIIHEVLHTLGLGENPPSSKEITRRVLAGCRS